MLPPIAGADHAVRLWTRGAHSVDNSKGSFGALIAEYAKIRHGTHRWREDVDTSTGLRSVRLAREGAVRPNRPNGTPETKKARPSLGGPGRADRQADPKLFLAYQRYDRPPCTFE
ncbi:Hypothetical protein MexAM1_META2p0551 (plasmid) [Methylorubrum extorquens AM1]|jgi:hypothetical protein|uniref:Uncharacterized protein n=1 Tax=Methylorubrum extorquens (strain ATCC 14718 / DSM 1338 / JCM 2805 / NCIMB 9133 / AM1) TaxID=272630 RepID=C5B4L6_METEA|nr:Hypothetical protein MexAM1_META2p0551 [Methylorubrum extorquens AM1]